MPVKYGSLTFNEAIEFFQGKVNVPTAAWTDLWHGMHARAFSVAGAVRDDMLVDFKGALDKVIAQGGSLADFRKDFDTIVDKFGWGYNGGRNWRTRVIYETNLRTAYQAGRYQQMQQVTETRPYWLYKHNDLVETPREQHLAWDGMVLRHDDPFWDTHYPPNGWGCRCSVRTLAESDLKRLGKTAPDQAPPLNLQTQTVGVRGPSPRTAEVPEGIDPGWAYNVGEAAWGRQSALKIIGDHGNGKWRDVPGTKGPADFGLGAVPTQQTSATMLPRARDRAGLRDNMREGIGGDDRVLVDPRGERILVGSAIVDHIMEAPASRLDGREQFFGVIPELVERPQEIWVAFTRHEKTGQYAIRRRYVKVVAIDKTRVMGLVGETVKGAWVGLTVFRGSRSALKSLRKGLPVYVDDKQNPAK